MKKINERELLKTPVFTVVEKEFEGVGFKPVGLNCNDWVQICAIDKLGNTVIVKQSRWGGESETTEFPCGTVEEKENPRTAAAREFAEETGIKINEADLSLFISFNPNPAYFNNKMHTYILQVDDLEKLWENRGKQHLDENEDCKAKVVKLKDVRDDLSLQAIGYIGLSILERYFTNEWF